MANQNQCRSWHLLCSAVALVLVSFVGIVAVQLADVSVFDDLEADLILAVGATQLGVIFWGVELWRVCLAWAKRTMALLGLESSLAIIVFIGIPWHVVVSNANAVRNHTEVVVNERHLGFEVNLEEISKYDSPAFRGARRDGTPTAIRLHTDWNRFPPRLLWRKPIGLGWSSFTVVGGFCVTQEQRGEFETIVCYELMTGRECWSHQDRTRFIAISGGDGPRATPAIHNGRVYALGATGNLNCLDGTRGMPIWSVNILGDSRMKNCLYGMAGSPLVIDRYVIVSPGGRGTSLVAYHNQSGQKIWSRGSAQASYSSPQPAILGGEQQVVIFNADGIYGHELTTGRIRWHYPWVSNPDERNNVCQPVILPATRGRDADLVFISSSYGKGCALLEVRRVGDRYTVQPQWSNRNLKAKFTSVVTAGDHVYGLDERILTCISLETGVRRWKRGRFGFGQLILVGGLLLIQAETGDIVLVKATPNRFMELARLAALNGRTWNHPVLAGQILIVRNDREAACFELPLAGG
jgi:outer membrane protein assembly factor BamB